MNRPNFLPLRLAWATTRFIWWTTEEFRKNLCSAMLEDLKEGRVTEYIGGGPLFPNETSVEVKRWRTGRIMRRAESRLRLAADEHEGDHWFAEAAKR